MKTKILKHSDRGVTFSDKDLEKFNFPKGQTFSFIIDKKRKKLIISNDGSGNTISRKKSGNDYNPLVDLRSKAVKDLFMNSYVKVEITKDTIFIEGIPIDNKENFTADLLGAIKVVSLFSGAGLLDSSFKELGFDIIFGTDMDVGATKTYKENIGEHIVCADINNLNKETIPDGNILIAGFPCVAFSAVNRSETRGDKHHAAYLFRHIIDIAELRRYEVIAVENVTEFITADNGSFFNEYKDGLEKLGYIVQHKIMQDKDYGGFSDRKRVFIVATLEEGFEFIEKSETIQYVRDAFNELIKPDSPNQEDYSKAGADTLERIKYVKQGGNWKDIPEHLRSKGKFNNYFRRVSLDGHAPTLVNFRKSMILSPVADRILSIREAAAIMGLSPYYKFLGTLNEMQQQVANGVTRALGRALAKSIMFFYKANMLVIDRRL